MNDHQKQTEFLRLCLLYDESPGREELTQQIVQLQRDARCVQRAVWLTAVLIALAAAGLGYGAVLVDNFPYNAPQFIVNLICALCVGSLVSLVAFMGLGIIYRRKLDRRREACRQRVEKLLQSRLGRPVITPLPDTRNHSAYDSQKGIVLVADKATVSR